MTNVNDVVSYLGGKPTTEGSIMMDVYSFFADLPGDLDLGSAAYYLKKEYKKNQTGIDDRYPVAAYVDVSSSGYDDIEDDWDEDEDEYWDDF